MEEESRTAAQKPRVMKKFSETQKAERALASTRTNKKQSSLASASNEGGEGEGEEEIDEGTGEGEGTLSPEGKESGGSSPRNKTLLSKLSTRLRGGGRGKKTNSSTASSKKTKE